jgi:hypothetical protein
MSGMASSAMGMATTAVNGE